MTKPGTGVIVSPKRPNGEPFTESKNSPNLGSLEVPGVGPTLNSFT